MIYKDGEWDVLKLPNSSVQVFDGLPCGTLLDVVLPNRPLPSGTPSRKRTRAACDGAESSPREETRSEADPDKQPAAVRVCRRGHLLGVSRAHQPAQ